MSCFFKREWSLPEKILLTSSSFMMGLILGFMFAPVKKKVVEISTPGAEL